MILNFITSAKSLLPCKITFTDSGHYDMNIHNSAYHTDLRAFALATVPAWNTLLLDNYLADSIIPFVFLLR